ncbi:MAG: DUF262 domain-containing protein [Candidatus Riflebacteria bacterium]|nr:DUF262 domain-containing protein [Candidatus Riflebacteria bacterium]
MKELIQKVHAGAVRIPQFQRPLRWNVEDVRRLFDSIWRGYPVGSLLFWKRQAQTADVRVGGATIQAPATTDAWWVVDGQQRTTALAASLLDLDHGGDLRWVLRFDPESQEFGCGPVPPAREGREVPLSTLGDLRRLGRWVREWESVLGGELVDRVEDAQQRILDYSVPAYIVDTDDEAALRAVFARLNSTGARMRADEVFQALLGAPPPDRGSLDLVELQRYCDLDQFGQPPRSEVLKAVLAMSGMDPSKRLEEVGRDIERLVSPEEARQALSRTVRFLISDCGIPHVSLIPYPVVFCILARWFCVHPRTQWTTLQQLARWVWRGAVTGAHQRAEVSRMREQVRAIRDDDEAGSLSRLLERVGPRPAQPWDLSKFNLKSARSRIEVLALLSLGPRDPTGPVSIRALQSSGRIAREIFAAADWSGLSADDRRLAQGAANRALLDSRHTGLQSEIRDWDAERHRAALESHLIDEPAFEALCQRNVGAFLRCRARLMVQLLEKCTAARAAWSEPILAPRNAYLEEDEDDGRV